MTLQELFAAVINSNYSDWHRIVCWGANTGPSYRDAFDFYETWGSDTGEREHGVLKVTSHSNIGVFTPDPSITLAVGLSALEHFKSDWASKFSDSDASSSYADVFFNGALVFRDTYVTVDGGRSILPLPKSKMEGGRIVSLEVPQARRDFIRLVHYIEGGSSAEFENYIRQAGFRLTNDPWPSFGD